MTRRGGILLETLLAITLFVVAALAVLQATSQANRAVERAVVPALVASRPPAWPNSRSDSSASATCGRSTTLSGFGAFDDGPAEGLRIEASTERSPHAGLTSSN